MSEQKITSLQLIATTADYSGPDNTFFEFTIPQVAGGELPLPVSPGNTSVWTLDTNPDNLMTAGQIAAELITLTDDNPFIEEVYRWQPASFYLIGKGEDGQYQVICAIPEWSGDALGTTGDPGVSATLDLGSHNQQVFP